MATLAPLGLAAPQSDEGCSFWCKNPKGQAYCCQRGVNTDPVHCETRRNHTRRNYFEGFVFKSMQHLSHYLITIDDQGRRLSVLGGANAPPPKIFFPPPPPRIPWGGGAN